MFQPFPLLNPHNFYLKYLSFPCFKYSYKTIISLLSKQEILRKIINSKMSFLSTIVLIQNVQDFEKTKLYIVHIRENSTYGSYCIN